jgi:hypothetical protein
MHLVQLLLPLHDNAGRAFAGTVYVQVRNELTERFGGVTAYQRSPAVGLWKDDAQGAAAGGVHADDVVIYEVMTDTLDRAWWGRYGAELAQRFRQKDLVVRAMPIERL